MKPSQSPSKAASKIYPSLNSREIAEDRRIINEKIRKKSGNSRVEVSGLVGGDRLYDFPLGAGSMNKNDEKGNGTYDGDDGIDMIDVEQAGYGYDKKKLSSSRSGNRHHMNMDDDYDDDDEFSTKDDMKEVYDSMQRALCSSNNTGTGTGAVNHNESHSRASGISSSTPKGQGHLGKDYTYTSRRISDRNISTNSSNNQTFQNPSYYSSGIDTRIGASCDASNMTTGISIYPYASIDIAKTQTLRKQLTGILYICTSFGVLVSYFFFLESCKLVNYGN